MSRRTLGYNRHLQTLATGKYEAPPASTEKRKRRAMESGVSNNKGESP